MKKVRGGFAAVVSASVLAFSMPLQTFAGETASVRPEGQTVVTAYVAGETAPPEGGEKMDQGDYLMPGTGDGQDVVPAVLILFAAAAAVADTLRRFRKYN